MRFRAWHGSYEWKDWSHAVFITPYTFTHINTHHHITQLLSSFTGFSLSAHTQTQTKMYQTPAQPRRPSHLPTCTSQDSTQAHTQQGCIAWEWAHNTWQSFENQHCSFQSYAEIFWNMFYNVSRHQRQFNSSVISQTPLPNKTHILSSLLHWKNIARHHG